MCKHDLLFALVILIHRKIIYEAESVGFFLCKSESLSKLISKRGVRLSKIPKEIITVLVMVFVFAVLNCCFIIILSLESGNLKSFIMCISILVSIVLTYYFMLYMMERFNYLMRKQYEDEMYREEMFYK